MVDENITNDMDDAVEPILPVEIEPEASEVEEVIEDCDDDDDDEDIDEDDDEESEV